ncbi:hypothetical protein [Nocardia thailandica]|uniref:hypothetical protein n=1 Tax=Nocardia thailandica TaxID=257275 RepID=UPI0002D352D7|nr:hypothetical protein [Nocardia thailandica]
MGALVGPFCRDCGTEACRGLLRTTLAQGWWGPFALLISVYAIGYDLRGRRAFGTLPAPSAPPGAARTRDERRARITWERREQARRWSLAWALIIAVQLAALWWMRADEDFRYTGARDRLTSGACAALEESAWPFTAEELTLRLCDDPHAELRIRQADFTTDSRHAEEFCGDRVALRTDWVTLCVEPAR